MKKEKNQHSGLIEVGSECFKEGGQRVNAAKGHLKENREVTTIFSNIGHLCFHLYTWKQQFPCI